VLIAEQWTHPLTLASLLTAAGQSLDVQPSHDQQTLM